MAKPANTVPQMPKVPVQGEKLMYSNKHPKTLPRKAMHVRGRNRGC